MLYVIGRRIVIIKSAQKNNEIRTRRTISLDSLDKCDVVPLEQDAAKLVSIQ